MTASVLSCIYR